VRAGFPDLAALDCAATATADTGRPIRSVAVIRSGNATGRLARPPTVAAVCQVAAAHQLVILGDEIYRDLVHYPATADSQRGCYRHRHLEAEAPSK
jgi:aspartate aminotransferase